MAICIVGACQPEFSVKFSTSSISTRALQGSRGDDAIVQITASGEGPTPDVLYVGATVNGMGIQRPIGVAIDPRTGSGTITVVPDTSIAAGDYAGTLTLFVCNDTQCHDNVDGSPHAVKYHVSIIDRLGASSHQVTVTTSETTIATPVPLTATLPAAAAVTYRDGDKWLRLTSQDDTVTLTADATALHAGTYKATVTLSTEDPRQMIDVPVTFIVTPALTPVSAAVTLTGASVPADMQGTFAVRAAAGVELPAWTASADAPWLVLDHQDGAAGDSASWHLDLAAVSALDNFATYTAHITVTAGPAITPLTVSVQLTKQLPEITDLDRLAMLSGEAGTVLIYGAGFQTIARPATDLRIAGVTPTAVTVLSDRAMSATVPALPAGEHAVTLNNALGIVTRSKPLSVLAPIDRTHQEIATDGNKLSLAWDAITQSAYVVNTELDLVMRFDLSHTPATVSTRRIVGVQALGLPLDRSVLVASDALGRLHDLDPTDLSLIRTRAAGAHLGALEGPIPMTGGRLAWISASGGGAYDLDRSALATWADPNNDYGAEAAFVSPDGRRMLYQTPYSPLGRWDTVEGTLHRFAGSGGGLYRVASDHAGDRWITIGGRVYDFDLATLGTITHPTDWYGLRYAMSRDGKRAYAYSISGNAIGTYSEPNPVTVFPKIFVFDTTGPLTTSTTYPLLGSFDVAAYASCLATQGPVVCSPYSLSFTISDDDRTLLAIGDRRLLVIPIPAQFRSP